jgi:hypothetical protein
MTKPSDVDDAGRAVAVLQDPPWADSRRAPASAASREDGSGRRHLLIALAAEAVRRGMAEELDRMPPSNQGYMLLRHTVTPKLITTKASKTRRGIPPAPILANLPLITSGPHKGEWWMDKTQLPDGAV